VTAELNETDKGAFPEVALAEIERLIAGGREIATSSQLKEAQLELIAAFVEELPQETEYSGTM
jgi:hypothetical protein